MYPSFNINIRANKTTYVFLFQNTMRYELFVRFIFAKHFILNRELYNSIGCLMKNILQILLETEISFLEKSSSRYVRVF